MYFYDNQTFDPPAPVAIVALRSEDRKRRRNDVVMMVDSAADATLLPETSVRQLGLEIRTDEKYELTAFDGTTSDANSVQCELIFLRRAFRGVFLVMNDTIGILGRDVLNHFSLVLDGPHLNWREEEVAGDTEV
jgi:hypothetical protein